LNRSKHSNTLNATNIDSGYIILPEFSFYKLRAPPQVRMNWALSFQGPVWVDQSHSSDHEIAINSNLTNDRKED